MIRIVMTQKVDNLCDYTFNFHWQNQKLDPDSTIPYQDGTKFTYRDLVDELKKEGEVHIKGDVGNRFAYSMGVDLKHFGGSGRADKCGRIFVEGNVADEAGMGMVSGILYIKGEISQPMGNIVELKSDVQGYRKFCSITDILCNGLAGDVLIANSFDSEHKKMVLDDGISRGTLAARCGCDCELAVKGDVYNGSGLLMQKGTLIVEGNAGMNTGAHLDGGTVVVRGKVDEFAGAYMKKGVLAFIEAKGYVGAQMEGGTIYSKKKANLKPPAEKTRMGREDISTVAKLMETGKLESMLYSKYQVEQEKERYIKVQMRDGSIVMRRAEDER